MRKYGSAAAGATPKAPQGEGGGGESWKLSSRGGVADALGDPRNWLDGPAACRQSIGAHPAFSRQLFIRDIRVPLRSCPVPRPLSRHHSPDAHLGLCPLLKTGKKSLAKRGLLRCPAAAVPKERRRIQCQPPVRERRRPPFEREQRVPTEEGPGEY